MYPRGDMFALSVLLRVLIFYGYIAVTCNSVLKIGNDDITGFDQGFKIQLCWISQVLEMPRNLYYIAESKTIPHFERR